MLDYEMRVRYYIMLNHEIVIAFITPVSMKHDR